MIGAVDHIADVVQVARDLRKLRVARGIAQRQEDFLCGDGNLGHMCEAVLGIAKLYERFIRFLDIDADLIVIFDLFIGQHRLSSFIFFFPYCTVHL